MCDEIKIYIWACANLTFSNELSCFQEHFLNVLKAQRRPRKHYAISQIVYRKRAKLPNS